MEAICHMQSNILAKTSLSLLPCLIWQVVRKRGRGDERSRSRLSSPRVLAIFCYLEYRRLASAWCKQRKKINRTTVSSDLHSAYACGYLNGRALKKEYESVHFWDGPRVDMHTHGKQRLSRGGGRLGAEKAVLIKWGEGWAFCDELLIVVSCKLSCQHNVHVKSKPL